MPPSGACTSSVLSFCSRSPVGGSPRAPARPRSSRRPVPRRLATVRWSGFSSRAGTTWRFSPASSLRPPNNLPLDRSARPLRVSDDCVGGAARHGGGAAIEEALRVDSVVPDPTLPQPGTRVAPFAVDALGGKRIDEDIVRSGVYLVGFFASMCLKCDAERRRLYDRRLELPVLSFV